MPKVLQLNPMAIITCVGASVQALQSSGGGMFQYPQKTNTNYTSSVIHVHTMMEDQGVWEAIEPATVDTVILRKGKNVRLLLQEVT